MSILGLVIIVLLLCVCVWAVRTLMVAFAIPPQIQAVVTVLIVVMFCLWIVAQLGFGGPILRLR